MPRAPRRRRKLGETEDKQAPEQEKKASSAKDPRSPEAREASRRRRADKRGKGKGKGKKPKSAKVARSFKAPKRRKAKAGTKSKRPSLSGLTLPKDVRFRASTRVKAVGYGAREQAWKLSRGTERRLENPVRGFWGKRDRRTKRIAAGVAGGALALALLLHTPFPGVPCSVSAVKECAPGDDAIALAPADSLVYAHLTLDDGTDQFEKIDSIVGGFRADRTDQLGTALLPQPSGISISFGKDIRPWAGDDVGVVITPGMSTAAPQLAQPAKPAKKGAPAAAPAAAAPSSRAFLISVADRKGADAFLAKVGLGAGRNEKVGDVEITVRDGSLTSAFDHGFLVIGGEAAVRSVAGTSAKGAKTLAADATADQIRGELPENRFADLYVSKVGAQQLFAASATTAATQLEGLVDYGATNGFAVGAVAAEGGVEINVFSALDPALQKTSPSVFTSLPKFRPTLTEDIGARALGYVGIGEAGRTLGDLLKSAGSLSPGLSASLKTFEERLRTDAKIDPATDLLPAFGGQAALVAEPTDGIPFASLIVDGVDEAKARDAMAKLQGPLVASLQGSTPAGQPLPGFQAVSLKGGVEASSLQVSPTINLTYAVFDRKLVVSTQPAGVEQVASAEGDRLAGAPAFTGSTAPLPREVSALVFVNLDELLDLAEALGRTEDPLYVSFRDDIRRLHALSVGVDAGAHDLRSKLVIDVD